MISYMELRCADQYTNRISYPGLSYAKEALEKTKKAFDDYNRLFKDTKIGITCSDNSEIEFEIKAANLCHCLGINHKNFMTAFWDNARRNVLGLDKDKYISAFEFLSVLLEKSDKILEYDANVRKSSKMLNYYKLSIKADIFNKLTGLFDGQFGCINFDESIYNNISNDTKKDGYVNKIFYFQSDEVICPYYMVGLVEDKYMDTTNFELSEQLKKTYTNPMTDIDIQKHVVRTIIAPINYADFFNNQGVVIPTQLIIDRNGELEKKEVSPTVKIAMLKDYRNLVAGTGITDNIDIYGDYTRNLLKESKQYKK